MSDVLERSKAVLSEFDAIGMPNIYNIERYKELTIELCGLAPKLVAELERLHSWDGLMSLLDEHYPADIFPTLDDDARRDPGPRIISLIRRINELEA